jgi:hypothetical protein
MINPLKPEDVFWGVAPCGLVDTDKRSRGAYCSKSSGNYKYHLL